MKTRAIEIKWAIIFSIVGLLWMLLEKLVGLHSTHIDKHMYLTNLFAIPAIIVLVLALKDKKQNFYKGQMSYKQGFVSGLILSVFIAVLSPLTQWITSTIITPEYFPNVIAYSVATGYHKSVAEAEAYFNLQNYIIQSTVGALLMGVITTAVIMVFLQTKDNKL
ncbi:DUF4199 domain-containing protein [Gelidibacter maritimus]|uniref:DUF4199 domain-containing protein n=1 Tax=Gelidibacter maritimus TaxID=2761487 RepID=A0A7W2R5E7_9FLAO|nr:DUF4199 domain-containing protein [Gelidibacter maritimus]MBA6154693.1 DUF4199 domain-containing protein [Gelidibacter maritimus]